jgi:hypothetical protein
MPGGLTIDRSIRPSPRPTTIRCQKTKPAITPCTQVHITTDLLHARSDGISSHRTYVSYTHAARSFCSLANVNVNKRKQSNAGAETTSRRIFKVLKKESSSS